MPELTDITDKQLMTLAMNSKTITVVVNCYTNRAGEFWSGTIFFFKGTGCFYDAEAGKPFSPELRSMLLESIKEEAPDA